jgi:quercetin dioxygenase-like cupin family protein
MQYGLKHLQVLAENDKVRVVRFAPQPGDKTPVHSHPDYLVYSSRAGG